MALSGETIALSGETIALSGETIVLSGETIVLSGETMALSGETIVLQKIELKLHVNTNTKPQERTFAKKQLSQYLNKPIF